MNDTSQWPRSLVLMGAGKMGAALLRGWLGQGFDPSRIHVVDPHLDVQASRLFEGQGVLLAPPETRPDVVVLAIKPQTFASDPSAFSSHVGPDTLVVSILAGRTLANLRASLPGAGSIVRAMPNLPASVGRGVTVLAAEPNISAYHHIIAGRLLAAVGEIEWLDESLIDAVTAVSGSGPAYVFLLAECLAEAGEAAGLPRDLAVRLARATVEGSGALMMSQPDLTAAALREAVTSPGGTTAAALDVLRAPAGLTLLLTEAVMAAKRRAGELAG